ncbi:oxidoreductase [Curtobacterium sp. MCPF17_047]|uniref:SDR family NAD(P)-dependent oxidoreductase n=1 Tax=unclassified Curtobacterium TaxID=257496 RepID=UPI000DA8A5E8|nr:MULTISPECIES: SDR family NAD(P)-dependent oxidoreductase [unclassified Curtobacterium]PZF67697.1 oxidoreductase [Curtobacterium sp. MCPF17_047]WIB12493.1 SDR family NAD(P)-dependent oxidoreductase [Curtobacterium sp. MCPF17_052]
MSEAVRTPFTADATAADVLAGLDLHGKRYVVTGGGSGIGAETVLALAAAGADVTVGVRDPAGARARLERDPTPGAGRVDARPLDLADLRSVRRFTDGWEGPVDGVVANAGVMALPTRQLSSVGWEMQLATNHLGHFALLLGLRAHLAAADGARVVTVSSTAHLRSPFHFEDPFFANRPYDRWAAYAQSKTADVLLAVGVADRWADAGVTANSLMPGWITTGLQRHLDDATLRAMGALDDDGNRIEQSFFKTPAQGAATSTLLVASPLVAGVTARYFEDGQEAPVLDDGTGHDRGVARYALDPENADRLWELSAGYVS